MKNRNYYQTPLEELVRKPGIFSITQEHLIKIFTNLKFKKRLKLMQNHIKNGYESQFEIVQAVFNNKYKTYLLKLGNTDRVTQYAEVLDEKGNPIYDFNEIVYKQTLFEYNSLNFWCSYDLLNIHSHPVNNIMPSPDDLESLFSLSRINDNGIIIKPLSGILIEDKNIYKMLLFQEKEPGHLIMENIPDIAKELKSYHSHDMYLEILRQHGYNAEIIRFNKTQLASEDYLKLASFEFTPRILKRYLGKSLSDINEGEIAGDEDGN